MVGENVPGASVCMSNAVRAEAKDRGLFFPALLIGSVDLLFGVAIVVVVISSADDCASVCGGEGD